MSLKKSQFSAIQTIADAATLDYVLNGQNFKISKEDFLSALGVTGTLTQAGDVTGTPVLDLTSPPNYIIRNIENGPGVKAGVSPQNGITIEHNIATGLSGVPVFTNTTSDQPLIRALLSGDNVSITVDGDALRIDAAIGTVPNTVVVQSADDFPSAVLGVRTLTAADPAVYVIKGNINLGTDVLEMEGGNLISGDNATISSITTNSTAPTITAINGAFAASGLEGTAGLRINNTGTGAAVRADGSTTILFCDTLVTSAAGNMLEIEDALVGVDNWSGFNITNGLVMTGIANSGPILSNFNPVAASGRGIDIQGNITSGSFRMLNLNASSVGDTVNIAGDIVAMRITGSARSTGANALNISGTVSASISINDSAIMSEGSNSIDITGSTIGSLTIAESDISSTAIGFYGLVGDAASANIGVSASISNSRIDGNAGALSGITKKDIKYNFSDVIGVPNSVNVGCATISAPASTPTTTINVWVRIAGTTTTCPTLERFSQIANNSLQYDGTPDLSALVIASFTADKGGATQNYEFAVAVDGVIDTASIMRAEIKTSPLPVTVIASIDLQNGEEVGIWARNISSNDAVTIETMNVVIR